MPDDTPKTDYRALARDLAALAMELEAWREKLADQLNAIEYEVEEADIDAYQETTERFAALLTRAREARLVEEGE